MDGTCMLAPKSHAAVSRKFMRNLYYLPKYLETHTIYTLFGCGEAPNRTGWRRKLETGLPRDADKHG